MPSKINFITGEQYTLAEIFSGEHKIIIPDLQRDYCWGDESHTDKKKELVTDFVNSLIALFENNSCTLVERQNLGLIYGYEMPKEHIQLCDGQQRLTTLFLLIGMLNRFSGNNAFQRYLISDYELNKDDKEPYLQYSIRESSLYFLSDLVCRFFIVGKGEDLDSIDNIRSTEWYFNEYNLDPSIQSMLRAMVEISMVLQEKLKDKNTNKKKEWIDNFGNYLLNRVVIMYYDMGNRRNGEETFVVINTTGEPLSGAQNLKPLVMSAPVNSDSFNIAERWEDMENWFWKKRGNGNDTSDAGFEEFLRWLTIIHHVKKENKGIVADILKNGKHTFPANDIPFESIYSYWNSVKRLYESEIKTSEFASWISPKEINGKKEISQIDCFRLLPLITYCNKFGNANNRNMVRVQKFFDNMSRYKPINVEEDTVFRAIAVIFNMTEPDILCFLDNQESRTFIGEEEVEKLMILKNYDTEREEIENAFWQTQDSSDIKSHKIWNGKILPLIKWSQNANGEFDLTRFKFYSDLVDTIFTGRDRKLNAEHEIDLFRRALIVGIPNYQPATRGGYKTFGWEWADWRCLIDTYPVYIKQILDDVNDGDQATLEAYLQKHSDVTNKYTDFAHDAYLLGFTHGSYTCDIQDLPTKEDLNICVSGGNGKGKGGHTGFLQKTNALIMKEFLRPEDMDGIYVNYNNTAKRQTVGIGNWGIWFWANRWDNCIVIDNEVYKIDIRYDNKCKTCNLQLKRSNNGPCDISVSGFNCKNEIYQQDIKQNEFNAKEIKAKIIEIINEIEKMF